MAPHHKVRLKIQRQLGLANRHRVLVLATVSLSILIHLQLLDFSTWIFIPQAILLMPPQIPQIWRVLSSFCITLPGLGILFDSYFCASILHSGHALTA